MPYIKAITHSGQVDWTFLNKHITWYSVGEVKENNETWTRNPGVFKVRQRSEKGTWCEDIGSYLFQFYRSVQIVETKE